MLAPTDKNTTTDSLNYILSLAAFPNNQISSFKGFEKSKLFHYLRLLLPIYYHSSVWVSIVFRLWKWARVHSPNSGWEIYTNFNTIFWNTKWGITHEMRLCWLWKKAAGYRPMQNGCRVSERPCQMLVLEVRVRVPDRPDHHDCHRTKLWFIIFL